MDAELTSGTPLKPSFIAAYGAMVAGGVALFFLIRRYGETLTAPSPVVRIGTGASSGVGAVVSASPDVLLHVLLALAAVIVTGRVLGRLLQAIGQPPVIGEVLAGISLGPSLLGRLSPSLAAHILPGSVAPALGLIAQVAIALYMFLVGLELNVDLVRGRAHATIATSHASIVAPFVLGAWLALLLYPRLSTSDVSFTSFALFMGVALSITAFPVLARILTDRRMSRTELGIVALTCAAADDVTAWCLLALVVGVTQANVQNALMVAVLTMTFIACIFLVIRPLATRLVGRTSAGPSTGPAVALAIVGLVASASLTEWIGVHAVFGAFLFGAVIPHDSALAALLTARLKTGVVVFLLPAFFAFTGLRTEIGLVSSQTEWLLCGLIIVVATVGKFGGTLVAARLTGMDWPGAAGLGVLMNARGLMELVVLNIGLDLGVISPTLFTMMVLMALTTTLATTPVLQLLGIGATGGSLQYNPAGS